MPGRNEKAPTVPFFSTKVRDSASAAGRTADGAAGTEIVPSCRLHRLRRSRAAHGGTHCGGLNRAAHDIRAAAIRIDVTPAPESTAPPMAAGELPVSRACC